MINNPPNLIVIFGLTAPGKTTLGVALAQRQGTPTVSLPGGGDIAVAAMQRAWL